MKLHTELLTESLWKLLLQLMQEPALGDFYLVGGTALALLLGHRSSHDLDLFTNRSFNPESLLNHLSRHFPTERIATEEDTVRLEIGGIKVEMMAHPHALLDPLLTLQGVRMASLKDLAAFKLNAISGRGLRRDFIDLAALLDLFSLQEMIGFFRQKYAQNNVWHLVKALGYYDNADQDQIPLDLKNGQSWQQVKSKVQAHLQSYLEENT